MTLATLSSVLDGVHFLDDVGSWLQIPDSKRDELNHQYDRRQLPRAYSTIFLADNPSPSWSTVALALWQIPGETGALEEVQKSYLKGELCAHSCRSGGRIGSLLAIIFHPSDTVWLLNIGLKVFLVRYCSILLVLYNLCILLHCYNTVQYSYYACNCVHTSSLVALVQPP